MEKEEDITMKKTYKIEVDCAACALKMEDAAKKVEGVTDATRQLHDPEDEGGICRWQR